MKAYGRAKPSMFKDYIEVKDHVMSFGKLI